MTPPRVCSLLAHACCLGLVRALGDGEVVVRDGVLGPEFVRGCAAAVRGLDGSVFAPFGTGRRDEPGPSVSERLRGDHCAWFDERGALDSGPSGWQQSGDQIARLQPRLPELAELFANFDAIRLELNEACFLSLNSLDCQLARYPADGVSGYPRHVDALRTRGSVAESGSRRRVITCIVYLNEGWAVEHGGELRIWGAADMAGTIVDGVGVMAPPRCDIVPALGRLVLFSSVAVPHAVLPSCAQRHAATAWFC
ncbi:hypothetical protein T492DRAFT_841056 [Pavlovales sp. CCMP2436]|nr:hypothetical protein T492DRAFT_841056 [Pavlovales sp. CCMP2436]